MNTSDIKLGTVIRHKRTGRLYVIISEAVWINCIPKWYMISYKKYCPYFRMVRELRLLDVINYDFQ